MPHKINQILLGLHHSYCMSHILATLHKIWITIHGKIQLYLSKEHLISRIMIETICQFLVRDIGVWLAPMKVAAYRSLFDWSWESLRATLAGDTYEERPTVEVCSHGLLCCCCVYLPTDGCHVPGGRDKGTGGF